MSLIGKVVEIKTPRLNCVVIRDKILFDDDNGFGVTGYLAEEVDYYNDSDDENCIVRPVPDGKLFLVRLEHIYRIDHGYIFKELYNDETKTNR